VQEASNPASRILAILRLLGQQRHDVAAHESWAKVFGLEANGAHVEDEIALALHALRAEITLVEQQLAAMNVPAEAYAAWLSRCRNGCSITRLHQTTKTIMDDVGRPEVALVLEWASWALRAEDENELDQATLDDLLAQMADLEAALRTAPLTPYGRGFVERQIATIKAAIRLYRVKGGKALRDGFGNVAAAYKIEEAAITREVAQAPEEGKSVVSRLFEGVKKVGELCDATSKIHAGIDSAVAMGHSVLPLISDALKHFPPGSVG
jgi:hypothetical protein